MIFAMLAGFFPAKAQINMSQAQDMTTFQFQARPENVDIWGAVPESKWGMALDNMAKQSTSDVARVNAAINAAEMSQIMASDRKRDVKVEKKQDKKVEKKVDKKDKKSDKKAKTSDKVEKKSDKKADSKVDNKTDQKPSKKVAKKNPAEEVKMVVVKRDILAERNKAVLAFKTNLLKDIALVPDLSAEICLGNRWSLSMGGHFAWWSNNHKRHIYWDTYGAELGLRCWLGKRTPQRRLTGHHIGVCAQAFTFDFETDGLLLDFEVGGLDFEVETGRYGYIASSPIWSAGLEYGYSWAVSKNFNMDFTISAGYMTGKYKQYKPANGHYVWQATNNLKWYGPTKVELTLTWLLGRSKGKGGSK